MFFSFLTKINYKTSNYIELTSKKMLWAVILSKEMVSKAAKIENLKGRNRFRFIKVLANTLQGRIYLVQDKKGEYPWVVVKETWKELVKQGKSREGHKVPENFENEKKVQLFLSNLEEQNEGYVRCIENWEDENCYYLAMEYCAAGELFDFIRDNHTKGKLNEVVKNASSQKQKCQDVPNQWSLYVQSIFRQLVDTVSWMHRHGVAHLDLSLENTMLASADKNQAKVKIIDFGLAQQLSPDQTFQEKVGKLGYMSPEVIFFLISFFFAE
ncbi:calcium-dependent protein kinase [Reticulomyxa filosa]|uniref:Calcium-dependent protein kinase n=1 Tax=Reticulomyxa filosa TaxID=46433 RepID=X6NIT2_RETFI|nr:calcium-dependent protein kinase [Reticulomyxa filosa]|eukprot:ETO25813.1 calcium-dependent protein kinase [Reticulomyxa filosa]